MRPTKTSLVGDIIPKLSTNRPTVITLRCDNNGLPNTMSFNKQRQPIRSNTAKYFNCYNY